MSQQSGDVDEDETVDGRWDEFLGREEYEVDAPPPEGEPPSADNAPPDWSDVEPDAGSVYLTGRLPDRTYFSKSFPDPSGLSDEPRRFVYKVFDSDSGTSFERSADEWVLRTSPGGRAQVKLLLAGDEDHRVERLWIQRDDAGKTWTLLCLEGEHVAKLIDLVRLLPAVPMTGQPTSRIDDDVLREALRNPDALTRAYQRDKQRFREVIESDAEQPDVIATAYRREQVHRFERLLHDPAYFAEELAKSSDPRPEALWQRFFQKNPWIFGYGLDVRLLTAWDEERLEQTVVGHSVAGPGKRVDALLSTAEVVSSLVFVEIKTPSTPLLTKVGKPYRPGCWAPSAELAGGVAQLQGTIERTCRDVGARLSFQAEDGSEVPNRAAYLVRPRSFLVIGQMDELRGSGGGVNLDKFTSFELYRRNLTEPDVVTFDALFQRARCIVDHSV